MSADSIQKALDGVLIGYQSTNVALEGVPYAAVDMTPYLSARMSSLDRIAVGAGRDGALRWTGTYQINVHFPTGEGVIPALKQVNDLLVLFKRGNTFTTSDGLSVLCEAPKTVPRIEVDAWITAPVLVSWFCYEMPT